MRIWKNARSQSKTSPRHSVMILLDFCEENIPLWSFGIWFKLIVAYWSMKNRKKIIRKLKFKAKTSQNRTENNSMILCCQFWKFQIFQVLNLRSIFSIQKLPTQLSACKYIIIFWRSKSIFPTGKKTNDLMNRQTSGWQQFF